MAIQRHQKCPGGNVPETYQVIRAAGGKSTAIRRPGQRGYPTTPMSLPDADGVTQPIPEADRSIRPARRDVGAPRRPGHSGHAAVMSPPGSLNRRLCRRPGAHGSIGAAGDKCGLSGDQFSASTLSLCPVSIATGVPTRCCTLHRRILVAAGRRQVDAVRRPPDQRNRRYVAWKRANRQQAAWRGQGKLCRYRRLIYGRE